MQFKRRFPQSAWPLLLGLAIREVFSFWTGHPYDFELWIRVGYAMVHGGNPYGFLASVPGLSFADIYTLRDSATIAYLPFWPLATGAMYMLYFIIGLNNRFLYYFLLKQSIIIGDVWLGYLLFAYVRSRKPRIAAWVLRVWMFSPFTIILSGIWGMFDSLAMAFIMISVMSTRCFRRAFWTGLGIFVKSIPVIYAIPLSIKGGQHWQPLLLAMILPISWSAVTFVVMGWPMPAIASALTYTVTRAGESMSLWDALFYFSYIGIIPTLDSFTSGFLGILWIPAVVGLTTIAYRKFRFNSDFGLIQSLLVVTLSFLIFKGRVTEQYAIYLLALSILDVALWNPKRKTLLWATMSVVLLYLVSNNLLLIRFLSPVYPEYGLVESDLSRIADPGRLALNFLLGSLFSALNAWYLIAIMRNHPLRATSSNSQLTKSS